MSDIFGTMDYKT